MKKPLHQTLTNFKNKKRKGGNTDKKTPPPSQGNATFNNYLNGSLIGTVFIDNLLLLPGNNTAQMHANISQTPVLAAVSTQPYCQTGILPFGLLGTNVTNHGQHLSYFADALASTNQTTDINIGAAIQQSLNFTIKCGS